MESPSTVQKPLFQLHFSSTIQDGLDGTVEVQQYKYKATGDGRRQTLLYVKSDQHLMVYEYNASENSWILIDAAYDVFETGAEDTRCSWYMSKKNGTVIVRKKSGLWFYTMVNEKLKELEDYVRFNEHEQVLLGNFFSHDVTVDVLVKNGDGFKIRSFDVSNSSLTVTSVDLPAERIQPESDVFLSTDFDTTDTVTFLVRTAEELRIMKFNDYQQLELVASCSFIKLPRDSVFDRMIFARFSNAEHKELLHFSSTGLDVYRFKKATKSYEPLYYTTAFSEYRNWNVNYINTFRAQNLDLGGDGIEELLCTGPSGVSVFQALGGDDDDDFYLEPVETKNIDDTYSFDTLKTLLPEGTSDKVIAVLHKKDQLYSVRILHTSRDIIPVLPEKNTTKFVPDTIPLVVPAARYARWLHEQLDLSELIQPINPLMGKVHLSFPLIRLDNIFGISVRKILQYQNGSQESTLGRGWSFPLEYIAIDRRGSIFEEDYRYILVKENNQVALTRNFSSSSTGELLFNVKDSLVIKYYKAQEKWEMENTEHSMKFIFGKYNSKKAMQYDPEDKKQTQPMAWYLIREEHSTGSYVEYEYNFPNDGNDVQLMKIMTDTEASVTFQYENLKMQHFVVQTANYQQNVTLTYLNRGETQGEEILSAMHQDGRPLFEFVYDSDTNKITRVVYPNGLQSTLMYKLFQPSRRHEQNRIKLNISDVQLFYGPDYSVIVDVATDKSIVHVRIRDLLGGKLSGKVDEVIFPMAKEKYVAFNVLTLENLFGVVLSLNDEKILCLFHFRNDKSTYVNYNLSLDATVKVNSNALFVVDAGTLKTFYVDAGGNLLSNQEMVGEKVAIHTINRGIILYDDNNLSMRYSENYQLWKHQESGFIKQMEETVDKFKLDPEVRNTLLRGLKLDMVQMYGRFIVLRTLEIAADNRLTIRLRKKLLNDKNEIVWQDNWRVKTKPILDLRMNVKTEDGGECTLGYSLQDGKYVTVVKKCDGPTFAKWDEHHMYVIRYIEYTADFSQRARLIQDELRRHYGQKDKFYKKVLADNPFAFDVSILGVFVDQDGIHTGGQIVSFDGKNWSQKDEKTDIDLSLRKDIKIKKLSNSGDTYKIFNGTKLLFDSNVTDPSSIKLSWPHYFAAQPAEGQSRMFLFDSARVVELPATEQLSVLSNNLVIVTTDKKSNELILRPVASFDQTEFQVVANQTLRLSSRESRITSYEYREEMLDAFANGYIFSCSRILPGGNGSQFGWYELTFDPVSRTSRRHVFNGQGQYVKEIEPQEESKSEKPDPNAFITDNTGYLPISEVSPRNISDGNYLYYGFEKYEKLLWKFDGQRLMTENGNRFLQLKGSSQTFEGPLNISQANETFIFSCWAQTGEEFQIGDQFTALTLSFKQNDKTMRQFKEAVVQQKLQNWFYIEIIIEVEVLAGITASKFAIAPNGNFVLAIDHIRFSPMVVNFEANIYRASSRQANAILRNNGLMDQYLLDSNGNRVIYITEQGAVTDFITYTKANYLTDAENLSLVIEIKPSIGVYEVFSDSNMWKTDSETDWDVSDGYLHHRILSLNVIKRTLSANCDIFAVRFLYHLQSVEATIQLLVNNEKINAVCRSSGSFCQNQTDAVHKDVSDFGEIVLLISKTHRALWHEGQLVHESDHNISEFENIGLAVSGLVTISETITLYDPSVKITYYNLLGLPVQTMIMQDSETVRIKEVVYDEIDRVTIATKWTTVEKHGNILLAYNKDFITGIESSQLTGVVDQNNRDCEGYPYFKKQYANQPTAEEVTISMPGKAFSVDQKYSRQLRTNSSIQFLDRLFPYKQGYTQQVEIRQNLSIHVTVSDHHKRKVAYYVQIGSFDERLTVYKYKNDKLEMILPPNYHANANTLSRDNPFWDESLSMTDKMLQDTWATRYTYNEHGQLESTRTPDSGVQKFIYDGDKVRYMVHSNGSSIDKVVYFSYGTTGKIVKEAVLDDPAKFSINLTGPINSSNFVEYYHGEQDSSPNIRHRSQESIRQVGSRQMMESLLFDDDERITKKIYVVPALNTSYSIDFEYQNDKLISIRYPIYVADVGFQIVYGYNSAGSLTSIGTPASSERFAKLQYNADGLVKSIQFEPKSSYNYTRSFDYNEPGYLKQISDPFLKEDISYLEADGYGSIYSMIFEGLISKTSYTANWYTRSNPALSKMRLNAIKSGNKTLITACIENLVSNGYYDQHHHSLKSFYPELDDMASDACRTPIFRKRLHDNEFPVVYGHSYDYDSHEQLVKAKYFQNSVESSWKPMFDTTFSAIYGINTSDSKNIWNQMKSNGFIIARCFNPDTCEGIPGKPFLHELIPDESALKALLLNSIANRRTISPVYYEEKCLLWTKHITNIPCSDTWKQLLANNFVGANSNKTLNALNPIFRSCLKEYTQYLPEIVKMLHKHFSVQLGKSPGDVLSRSIDANGNHRIFSTGFDQYIFAYKQGTNQISRIFRNDLGDETINSLYKMEHNSEGSVTVAMHKGIERIEYDTLLNRPSRIMMTDGRMLQFQYDVRGERTFKQVLDKDGNVWKEKYYIRNLDKNVLVDIEMTFLTKDKAPDVQVTSYIYFDKSLIGFIRNDEFYSVFTDHEGSVRLVIKDGVVKSSYDYLPYGLIFRKSESDFDGKISYLYTGQEWDEETGLYNYHFRLYDPEIGRFYQIDPKEQYASPYVYAGNSPIALIDPDGQLVVELIAVLLALIGAYLGGASANKSWNPAEWNWRGVDTWMGILGGVLTGYTLPFNFGSSLAYLASFGLSATTQMSIMIGTGIGFTYLAMAAANNNWDPAKWDMKSPATWDAFLTGVAVTSWIVSGPKSVLTTYGKISSTTGKALFITGQVVLSGGLAYMFGVLKQSGEFDPTKWDFTKPGLYMGLFSGAVFGTKIVVTVTNFPEKLKQLGKKQLPFLEDRLTQLESYLKYHMFVGNDWSKQLLNVRFILMSNSKVIGILQRDTLTLSLFSVITSLRVTKIVEHSQLPDYIHTVEFIKSVKMVEGFTDKLVDNITSAESPKLRMISDASNSSDQYVSSGASELFRSIFNLFKYRWSYPNFTRSSNHALVSYSSTKPLEKKAIILTNCYQTSATEGENPFLRCYGQRTRVAIYMKEESPMVLEDVFRNCYPLTYDHVPSVSCDGEKSSLLYTVHDNVGIFSMVDGWILLARVMPTAIRSIVDGMRYVFSDGQPRDLATVDSSDLDALLDKLECLRTSSTKSEWANRAFLELEEDVVDFFAEKENNVTYYDVLKERMEALQEDIEEEMEYRTAKENPNIFTGKRASDFGMISKAAYIGNIDRIDGNVYVSCSGALQYK